MARTQDQLTDEVQRRIRDKTGGTYEETDIQQSLNRCIRFLQNDHGMYPAKNRQDINVFPGIYEYPLPSDFHDIISIQDRGNPIRVTRKAPYEFWLRLEQEDNMVAIDTIYGDRFLLLRRASAGSRKVLHNCDSLTANGTWAVDSGSSDATNLTADTVNKKKGSASLNFDLDVSQSGNDYAEIQNSTMTALDLSAYADTGYVFAEVYIPNNTNISSFTMTWGSDASNTYAATVTTQHNGQSFRNGWNTLGFAWEGSTQTGTPVDTAIDYLAFRVTYTSSQTDDTDFRVDNIRIANPQNLEIHYYSSRFVKSNAGALQDDFQSGDDYSLLATMDDDLLYHWACAEGFEALDNSLSQLERQSFDRLLSKVKPRYMSERKREVTRYY